MAFAQRTDHSQATAKREQIKLTQTVDNISQRPFRPNVFRSSDGIGAPIKLPRKGENFESQKSPHLSGSVFQSCYWPTTEMILGRSEIVSKYENTPFPF